MHSNQSWPPVISPLGVHPCFRNATRAKQGCCRDWQGHTIFVSIIRDSWVIQRRLFPHVIQWSQYWGQASDVQKTVDEGAYLAGLHKLGGLYRNQGRLTKKLRLYISKRYQGKKKALGTEYESTLSTVNNLGLLYWDQGQLAEAEVMYDRALAWYEKALGTRHASTLNTINNLGLLY